SAMVGSLKQPRTSHLGLRQKYILKYSCGFLGFFFLLGLVFFVFRDKVSLYSPGCPGTHSVDQAGLELRNPPASASQVCHHARLFLWFFFFFFKKPKLPICHYRYYFKINKQITERMSLLWFYFEIGFLSLTPALTRLASNSQRWPASASQVIEGVRHYHPASLALRSTPQIHSSF
ncbi:mCG146182, partial [Mus musculus]